MAIAYDGPIVDTDIHHGWKDPQDIIAYLPERWRDYVGGQIARGPAIGVVNGNLPAGAQRRDTYFGEGSIPGTDFPLLMEQLVDRYNMWRGVLTFNVGAHAQVVNPYYGQAVARAVHDWNADTWLTWDERLYGVVDPSLGLPDQAAEEVRRVGAHPRIVATLLAGSPYGCAYGDPIYHPVYAASAEMGLPIDIHPGASANGRPAAGQATSNLGSVPLLANEASHHITSFIVHGVFEKFPTLRVQIKEHGIAWLPALMWRLDRNYEVLRLESPWVKKWPSEYIREHVVLNTQPLELGPDPEDLERVLTSVDGIEDMLCFATDYPHISFDDPNYVAKNLPAAWARKVMCDNACKFYSWTPPEEGAVFKQALAMVGSEN
jgi:predicted TIM-barrel fold metal-dependent hydrolase